jgi:hypothetical protein
MHTVNSTDDEWVNAQSDFEDGISWSVTAIPSAPLEMWIATDHDLLVAGQTQLPIFSFAKGGFFPCADISNSDCADIDYDLDNFSTDNQHTELVPYLHHHISLTKGLEGSRLVTISGAKKGNFAANSVALGSKRYFVVYIGLIEVSIQKRTSTLFIL